MRKNKGLMRNGNTFLPIAYECLNMLHLSANKNVFNLMSQTVLKEWRIKGETKFADYFEKVLYMRIVNYLS